MADIAIFRINYKSDFILTLNSDAGWMTPFCIKFWTGAPSQAYFVGWDGTAYTNCAPVAGEPTKLLVQFDDHHLPVGELKFQIGYHFTVADFPNDTEDEVLNQERVIIEIDGHNEKVMLDFNGETAPDIEFSLPAYANEAQRIANEQQRIAAETQRIANEDTRIQHEEARIAAEQTRQQNEQQRINQEQARVNEYASLKADAVAATSDANDAATLANQKAQLAADKAALANDAATLANQKAQLAAEKAALANDAAQLANEKAALAQQKAEYAQQQGGYAKDQGDYAKNQGDYAKTQGDTALADHQRAEADHGIAVDDHTQAGNDHTRAESDHGIAVDDHTQAGNDHTRAESDHGIAVDDHTQAGNDHTRAESDHTRAESDHAAVEVYVDSLGAFDISAYHATGGVLAKYADLTAALGTNGANIPDTLRKGGMSVKFVQTSDNKYVQFRYMETSTVAADFINVVNWQGVDVELLPNSKNLAESGAAYHYAVRKLDVSYVSPLGFVNGSFNNNNGVIAYNNKNAIITDFIKIESTHIVVSMSNPDDIYPILKYKVAFYTSSKAFEYAFDWRTNLAFDIPNSNCYYMVFCFALYDSSDNYKQPFTPNDALKLGLSVSNVQTDIRSRVNYIEKSNSGNLQNLIKVIEHCGISSTGVIASTNLDLNLYYIKVQNGQIIGNRFKYNPTHKFRMGFANVEPYIGLTLIEFNDIVNWNGINANLIKAPSDGFICWGLFPNDASDYVDFILPQNALITKDSIKLRFMSWNIAHFNLDSGIVNSIITEEQYNHYLPIYRSIFNQINADFIAIQEYETPFWKNHNDYTTKRELFPNYKYFDEHGSSGTLAYFAHFPFYNLKEVVFNYKPETTLSDKGYVVGDCILGNKIVKVVYTHLNYDAEFYYAKKQIEQLISDFTDEKYVIMMADWNCYADVQQAFFNAGYTAANNDYMGSIETMDSQWTHAFSPVDNIFVKGGSVNNVNVLNTNTITGTRDVLSDHFPIYCDIVF